MTAAFSKLPSVDKLLLASADLISIYGRTEVKHSFQKALMQRRANATNENPNALNADAGSAIEIIEAIKRQVTQILDRENAAKLVPVINLTGTVLHTNLGRAELPETAINAIQQVAMGFSNLEYDLQTGQRGDRDSHVEDLLRKITGAEAATVVNNNAAAVLLTLNTLAANKQVPVSRGELVEIGGSFRIPEVMQRAGCHLVEVGATNRTHLKDYEQQINAETALLMKVHTSNYEILGFTQAVSDKDIATLADQHHIPSVSDLGSGTLVDLSKWGLPYETTVTDTLKAGIDVVTFSGDKLLGGPQCGIIVGSSALIKQIKSNPMKRALRVDKMTIAALYEVLKLYLDPDTLCQNIPTLRYLTKPLADIREMADSLVEPFTNCLAGIADVTTSPCESQIGSGSLPIDLLASYSLKITPLQPSDSSLTNLLARFRKLPTPVIGRLKDGSIYFDLRTLKNPSQLIDQLDKLPK
ncbi:MAG: L-seryl-tRNA(Sec) selenium transferase [Pseudomonadales bacterium]|nr:L-seryl-tRNA(Sec) selenium transferase [Pseudomonadales bacterium]MDG1442020.1 L-seryl-tRNA(Sec) selenium transferase [Pseudomonadales bacterium]